MTPAQRMVWEMICFDLCMLQYDPKQAQRYTPNVQQ